MALTQHRGFRSSVAAALATVVLATSGCRSSDPAEVLVLVPRPAESEPSAAPRFLLLARSDLTTTAATGHVELWLPLPASDHHQTVQSLSFEVGPPGTYEVQESPEGNRVLHVAGASLPVSIRAVLERASTATPSVLPPELAALEPALEPSEWADAATARGAQARVAHGLELTADGQTVSRRWPEVLLGGAWTAVPPEAADGLIRLATVSPRATVDGQPVEVRTSYSLERR
jgi:hypothetical protein